MKASHIMDALGYWLALDCLYLTFIHLNTIGSYYIPQDSDLMGEKGTLLKVPIELFFFHNLNDLPKVVQVCCFCLAVNEYIIKIENHKSINEGSEDMVHQPHKCARCIRQTKRHD